jgi:hypothetical protein
MGEKMNASEIWEQKRIEWAREHHKLVMPLQTSYPDVVIYKRPQSLFEIRREQIINLS